MVITGIGLLLPGVSSPGELADAIASGKKLSGAVDTPHLKGVKGLAFTNSLTKKTYYAMQRAIEDSGIDFGDGTDTGIFLGSAFGSLTTMADFEHLIETDKRRSAMPMDFMNTVMNAAAGQLAILSGLSGMNMTFSTGSRAAFDAVEFAADMLEGGRVRAAVAGGTEEMNEIYEGYIRQNGAEPSDGVCMLILERKADALKRGARIYAEILGMAASYSPEAPDRGAVIEKALDQAGISASDVSFSVTEGAESGMDIPNIDLSKITDEIYSASFAVAAAAAAAAGRSGEIAAVNSFGSDGFWGSAILKIV